MPVTSLHNPQVKYLSCLARRRFREREGKFIIEGNLMVREALLYKWPLEQLIYIPSWEKSSQGQTILALASAAGIQLLEVSEAVFCKLAGTKTPQGVLAVGRYQETPLTQLFDRSPSLLLLVDGVQDPGNLGTIVRSADAAGAQGVILLKGTVDLYNPKTLRATMGSLFHLPAIEVSQAGDVLRFASATGLQLVAGAPAAVETLSSCDLTLPTILAVGNESSGCSDEILRQANHVVSISMPGHAESLNAAVAASIMLYEAVRQRL
jgi:TrmH family RNA methyltransferase